MEQAAPFLRVLLAAAFKSAADGTLGDIVQTAAKLLRLVEPLLSGPATERRDTAVEDDLPVIDPHPALPEDPVFARQGQPKPSGH